MAEPQTKGVPDGWEVITPEAPRPAPEQGTLARMGAAVGPAIRGVGDVTGANTLLETMGAVDPGRLTGAEENDRDASTRTVASYAGGGAVAASMVNGLVGLAKQGGIPAVLRGVASLTVVPAVKYEVTKSALELLHIPPGIAMPIAMVVSGYGRSGKPSAPAEAKPPLLPNERPAVPMEAPLDMTRRLKAEWLEQHGGLDAARQAIAPPDVATPAPSPAAAPPSPAPTPPPASPATAPAPSVAPAGAASSASLKDLMASGLTPKEANAALKLLRQGMDPEAVQAQILAARPSPASVAPAAAAPPVESAAPPAAPAVTQSPIQKMTNIRPGVPPAPAQVQSAIGLAARRAGVTLAKEDVGLLTRAIEAGMAPETAVQQLPALKLQQMPGVLTPEQVNAEIAARGPGNRSPKR